MKYTDPLKNFFTVWLMGGGGYQNMHLNKVVGNFMKCTDRLKFFFTIWPMGGGGWGVKVCTWTKVVGNFTKCTDPLKFLFTVQLIGGGGVKNYAPEPDKKLRPTHLPTHPPLALMSVCEQTFSLIKLFVLNWINLFHWSKFLLNWI